MQQALTISIKATITQIAATVGLFFIFGYILSWLQKKILRIYKKSLGWHSILLTAWIGTPIHEFGHLLFALTFNYKIKNVNLLHPNKKTGRLGHVEYGYKKGSIIARMGQFFVASGSLIFGSGIIMLLLYFLVPNGPKIYASIITSDLTYPVQQIIEVFYRLFSQQNLSNPLFWLFIYLALSIVTHISPSKRDRSQMWKGLIWFMLIVFIFNLAGLALFGLNPDVYSSTVNSISILFVSVFLFSTLLAFIHYFLIKVLFYPFY